MNQVTATVEQKESIPVIRLSGYLSSESAGPLEEAFQQVGDAEKVLLVFAEKQQRGIGRAVRSDPASEGAGKAVPGGASSEALPLGV